MDPYADLLPPGSPAQAAPQAAQTSPGAAPADPYADLPTAQAAPGASPVPADPYADLPTTPAPAPPIQPAPAPGAAPAAAADPYADLATPSAAPAAAPGARTQDQDARAAIYEAFTQNRLTKTLVEQAVKLGILRPIGPSAKPASPSGANEPQAAGSPHAMRTTHSVFAQAGYSQAGIAGVLGNVMQESKGDPTAVGDSGDLYGLFQHNRPRKHALFAFARSVGRPASDPTVQAVFAIKEIRSRWPDLDRFLRTTNDPEHAAMVFGKVFENPHKDYANWDRRRAYARRLHGGAREPARG